MTRVPFALLAGGAAIAAAASLMAPAASAQQLRDPTAAHSMTVPPGQIAPGHNPYTRALNADVNGNIEATKDQNAASQAQYQTDLAAYDASLRKHGHRINRQNARYRKERQAYADAMRAWRAQVWDCNHGRQVACNAPTPDPTDFY
ncbi:MAG TPA: hypothetical protein VFL92_13840 [Sphingomonas sp.]|nr:hypothetical protein [Sphingomonas sp.]